MMRIAIRFNHNPDGGFMADLDMYLMRCYDALLRADTTTDEAELCACAKLVERDDAQHNEPTK